VGSQPVGEALRRRQRAVQRDDVAAGEALGEARFQLRRQVDLGHQHQRLPPERERALGRAQVDLGLAAAGHAMQQHGRCRRVAAERLELLQRLRLLGARCGPRRLAGRRRQRARDALAQLGDAVGELGVVELAQFGRQHRQRHFADTSLVVRGGELDQRAPRQRQRRQRVEHRDHRPQSRGRFATRLAGPHHARQLPLAQRGAHQRAGRERSLAEIVERRAQSGVLRRLHRDAQADRIRHTSQHQVIRQSSNPPQGRSISH
jgi:hypothetical protein